MRFYTLGFLALTATTAGLLHFDRMSSIALNLVELETAIGVPIPAVLGACALLSWFFERKNRTPAKAYKTTRAPSQRSSASKPTSEITNTFDPDRDWFEQTKSAAKAMTLPAGARLSLDPKRPCPVELHLEQAPPERAKRAIVQMASWIASVPTPPRARVVFDHCPEGGSPRHHQVAGALAEHLDRSQFRTSTDLDAVNIFFHHPDPRWTN